MDLVRAVQLVDRAMSSSGQSWAIIGGLSLQALGLSRATFDLDIAAGDESQAGLEAALRACGYTPLPASPGFANFVHPDPSFGRIDIIYVDGVTAGKLFAACSHTTLLGTRVLIPRPEHLIAMKVQAIKNDPRRTFQDLADVQFLISLPGVDLGEVEGYFQRAGLEAKFEELRKLSQR